MSFVLKSVELQNIRAHEYFLFEPAPEGTTAISGDNGAGKSTVVDAFAWGLYGTRPTGVKNKNLIRDGVDPKTKPVSVKSIIVIGGIEYAIERKIITESGTTECNVWGKKPGTTEFAHVAGPSVTHVEKFIRSELGMNEKGFLTSVLIQQKQVDQIVSATPRERGVVIEELTGISTITQAITKTNEATRDLERASSALQVGNVDEAKEKVSNQEEICEALEKREKEAFEKFNEAKKSHDDIKKKLYVEEKKVKKRIKLNQEINSIDRQIAFLKKQSKDDMKYIADYEEKYGTSVSVNTKEIKSELENKRKSLQKIQSEGYSSTNALKNVEKELTKISTLKGDFSEIKSAEKTLTKLKKDLNKAENELQDSRDKEAMYTSEIKHAKASHEHIDGEDKNCPVCKSSIEDPVSLREQIEKDIKSYESEKEKVKKKMLSLNNNIKVILADIKKAEIAIEALKSEDKLSEEKVELEAQLTKLRTEVNLVKEELSLLDTSYDKALKVEADKNALESAKERSLTVNTNILENNAEKEETEREISELGALSDEDYNSLIAEENDAKDELSRITFEGKEIRGRKILEYERLNDYKNNLKAIEDSMERYNEIAEKIEISSSASAILSSFKADRIEQAIPTLEFYASDFLSKFTGGAFVKLSIDEKFNTFVTTAKGVVRPVSQLSGGELSSSAIALRLGIAMLLNSSEKNVLILDEVLVSMDEDRSRQIMETIGSMTNSQVIFIAHNSDINSVADKTVLVTK